MKNSFYFVLLALAVLQACNNSEKLPYLGQRQAIEKEADGNVVVDTLYQKIGPFTYLNQDSVAITDKTFDGKIYVADFFFTSCNTICPVMHRNMLNVYNKYKDNADVMFLSHSIDVKYDIPSKLKSYAQKLGIEGNKWQFVHGSKDSIFGVSAKEYMVAAYEDNADPQGLVHQGWFILVDKNKHLRGAYDGTKEDQVEKMMKDMDILLKEENDQ